MILKAQYPFVVAHSIPNGGKRGKHAQRELKHTGCLKGVPDLFIAVLKYALFKYIGGLYIELKAREAGVITDEQLGVHARLRASGYQVNVCRSFDEAKQVIDNYLKH